MNKDDLEQDNCVNTIISFRELLVNCQSLVTQLNLDIKECDKAFCDVRHYCEFNDDITPEKEHELCNILRNFSLKRRNDKNILQLLTPLFEVTKDNPKIIPTIGKLANDTNKEYIRNTAEKSYLPRVLKELFEENDTDDD